MTRISLRLGLLAFCALSLAIGVGLLLKRPYLVKTMVAILPKTYLLKTGDWDQSIREIGNIVFKQDTGEYILYYSGLVGENVRGNNEVYVGAAVSKDKQTWEKIGKVFDEYAEDPFVIYCKEAFWMFYEEKSRIPDNSISVARSQDGKKFEVFKKDIITPRERSFQSRDTSSPVAVCLDDKVVVLYEARDQLREGATLGYAESTDFMNWNQLDRPVFEPENGAYVVPDDLIKQGMTYSLSYHDVDRALSRGKTTWLSSRLDSVNLQEWTKAPTHFARRDYTMFFEPDVLMTSDDQGIYTFKPFFSL